MRQWVAAVLLRIAGVGARAQSGAKIASHWHPEDEDVTVLRGGFSGAMGDKFDDAALRELPPGSYLLMPKNMHRSAKASGQTILAPV